jgi:hypothetical protein
MQIDIITFTYIWPGKNLVTTIENVFLSDNFSRHSYKIISQFESF